MNNTRQSERGQAIVLMVLAMVAMFGFAALAIDGGMIYSEHRHAQNAADASALAGALQKANKRADTVAINAATERAGSNGYTSNVNTQVSGALTDLFGTYYLVTVTIQSQVDTAFAHFVFPGPLQNSVMAVGKAYVSQPVLPGYAIIAMGNCTTEGGNQVAISGGGNSGGVETFQGGIFLNTPESSANNCAIDPPTSNPSIGVIAHDGAAITSVGSHNYSGIAKISPSPIGTGANDGLPINDPLAELPEPSCTSNGGNVGGIYQPGRYGGSGQPAIGGGSYAPGIYCITGDVHLSGSEVIDGDGVVLFMKNGGLTFTGQAGMRITAPTTVNCLGTAGSSTASCTYLGIAVFMGRSNTATFEVRGNGGDAIHGLIYALSGTVQARGGGVDPDETNVIGQVIARRVYGDGNGSFKVTYNENETFYRAPSLNMEK